MNDRGRYRAARAAKNKPVGRIGHTALPDFSLNHIGRAVRFVDFIARFSTDIVYFSYRSSHLSLPIFVTDKSCL